MKSTSVSPERLAGDTGVVERPAPLPAVVARPAPAGGRFYLPALDGIRALAVTAVLLFHHRFTWATGGFLGVDAFFVLSGFLITTLMLNEWQATGQMSLTAFWARRARRLLPALFLVMLAIVGYAIVLAEPWEMENLRGDALATVAGVANWRPLTIDEVYFTPLRHIWSLSIEQQWYAVWPFIFFAFMRLRNGSPWLLLAVAIAMLVSSVSLMAWLHGDAVEPSRAYYGTDTRAQSLLVGSALAMVLMRSGPVRNLVAQALLQVAAVGCVLAVGYAWHEIDVSDDFLYQGGLLLLALAVAVVITAAAQPVMGVGTVLSFPPLRWLGLISYGVYLWHWPVFFVLTPDRTDLEGYSLFALRAAVTIAISAASYVLFETPFRRGAFRRSRIGLAMAPAGALSTAALVFLVT